MFNGIVTRGLRRMFSAVAGKKVANKTFGTMTTQYDVLLVNDASTMQKNMKKLDQGLKSHGLDVSASHFEDHKGCMGYLQGLENTDLKAPSVFMLDSCGVGVRTAFAIEEWYTEHRPDQPLPYILMSSTAPEMSVNDVNQYTLTGGLAPTDLATNAELSAVIDFLGGQGDFEYAMSRGLRRALQELYGIECPETPADNLRKLMDVSEDVRNTYLSMALGRGRIKLEEYISERSPKLREKIKALQTLELKQSAVSEGVQREADETFYDATSNKLASGPVCFSIKDINNEYYNNGYKPLVLVMQSYDPEVIPLLSDGRLAGVVILSPYMASHIKLLCEANGVAGAFGLIPDGLDKLSAKFDEFAQPDLPPLVEGDSVEINGKTLHKGDGIILGLDDNGIALIDREKLEDDELYNEIRREDSSEESKLVEGMSEFNLQIDRFFAAKQARGVAVKVNVDTTENRLAGDFPTAGLVRTEQLASSKVHVAREVRHYFLKDEEFDVKELKRGLSGSYESIFCKFRRANQDDQKAVKIRLFDFSFDELFNAQDLQKFRELYNGRAEIRGMEAVKTWGDLYKLQVEAILDAQEESNYYHDDPLPVEIMMPAMRTADEVKKIKSMVMQAVRSHAKAKSENVSFGVMIETVRSCQEIEAIAKQVDFISFGTNDLTQEYTGIGRGDLLARKRFMAERGFNPFVALAPEIQELMGDVVTKARAVNPDIRVDICGAQAANLDKISDFEAMGIDAISVAPNKQNLYVLSTEINLRRAEAYIAAQKALQVDGAEADISADMQKGRRPNPAPRA